MDRTGSRAATPLVDIPLSSDSRDNECRFYPIIALERKESEEERDDGVLARELQERYDREDRQEHADALYSLYPSEGTVPRSSYSNSQREKLEAELEANYLPSIILEGAGAYLSSWAGAIASAFELPKEEDRNSEKSRPRQDRDRELVLLRGTESPKCEQRANSEPSVESPVVQQIVFKKKL